MLFFLSDAVGAKVLEPKLKSAARFLDVPVNPEVLYPAQPIQFSRAIFDVYLRGVSFARRDAQSVNITG